jgi:glycerol transport system ATP-binding protein
MTSEPVTRESMTGEPIIHDAIIHDRMTPDPRGAATPSARSVHGLVLSGVGRTVGNRMVLRDISLAMEPGSLNVLLGPTLAGKTSLMRLMAGLDQPTEGTITFKGRDMAGVPVRERNVAMVYQQFINYPTLTVFENIASPLRVAGLPRADIDTRVRHAARLLRLEPYLTRTPLQLSGGQQQRTAIARALVKQAGIVLMDEPLANLDYKLREELREELPRIFADSGSIFVYATTEPMEALLLGGHTATMSEGRVTEFGPTAQVYRRPRDLVTAAVFSDPPLNVLGARKRGGVLSLIGLESEAALTGAAAALPDGDYRLGFRAHHLELSPVPGALAISTTVAVSEITGSESFVHLNVGSDRLVALAHGVRDDEPGQALTAWLDPAQAFFFDGAGNLAWAPALRRGL